MKKYPLLILVCIVAISHAWAQCMMYPIPLSSRIATAVYIIEGRVTSQVSFWDPSQSLIYTASTVDVYKIFKGNLNNSQIEIITEGGIVGNNKHIVEPSLMLNSNDIGTFFLEPSSIINSPGAIPNNCKFQPYASAQGFIKYDVTSKDAHDVFYNYTDINNDIYTAIANQLQSSWQDLVPFKISLVGPNFTGNSLVPPVIATITPNPIVAGRLAGNILTITGANFGAAYSGLTNLEFPDANNGGAGYIATPANHIVTWTAGSISCWVPTGAGSGFIRITNNLGEVTTAGISLTINYNETNVVSGGIYYMPDLVNDNGLGGFTYVYNTTFNGNALAVSSFERALQTWRCGTYVNFWRLTPMVSTGISCQANDGSNVVMFDGGCAVPAGVLGISYSYYGGCGGGTWYVTENDLKFRTNGTGGINWQYGPASSTVAPVGDFDFESVCLHELGHSHQLGHTITPVTVMNYAVGPDTDRRLLNAVSELAGGNDIMARSIVNNACGPTAMVSLNGTNCFIAAPTAQFSGTPTTGCNSINVTFTDLSVGTPTGWTWAFPGGVPNSFIGQNPPTINYAAPGVYNVTLTVTNASGSDNEVKNSYITVNSCPAPVPDFSASPTTACVGANVSFTDLSTQSPTSWSWAFGPSAVPTTSTLQNPVVTYSVAGVYNVTLTATSANGSNSITKSNYITVLVCPPAPIPDFTGAPLSGCSPLTVNFTNLTAGAVNSYQWNFAGGTPATSFAINPTVVYNVPGVYSVILQATNNAGTGILNKTNYITVTSCVSPIANFQGGPTQICTGGNVSFGDLSSGNPTSWTWTFTGGVPAAFFGQSPPTINYAVAGTYQVQLLVSNVNGSNTQTLVNYITVTACPAIGSGVIVNDGGFIYVQPTGTIQVGTAAAPGPGGFINQDNGANIGNIDNRGQIFLTGDWTNNSLSGAMINLAAGEVQLTGIAQTLGGTTPTDFFNLTLLGTGVKTQTVNQNVYGTLALNDRELATQNFMMYVRNPALGAITRTPVFNATTVQGFVSSLTTGRLLRNTNTTGVYDFPVGSGLPTARYRPIRMQPSTAAAHTYGVRMVNNDPTFNTYDRNLRDPFLGVINPYYYWKINQISGNSPVTITEFFDLAADAPGPIGNVLMTEWGFTGSLIWKTLGAVVNSSLGPNLSSTSKIVWNTFTTENYSFAGLSSPLPIELLTFEGGCTDKNVSLKWSTASETDCDGFEIQRSENGTDFITLDRIVCKGNSSTLTNYLYTDVHPLRDKSYYRLKQVDINGNYSISQKIVVKCSPGFHLTLYPNPASQAFTIIFNSESNSTMRIHLYDLLGQKVLDETRAITTGINELTLNIENISPAIYQLVIEDGNYRFVEKITIID